MQSFEKIGSKSQLYQENREPGGQTQFANPKFEQQLDF